MTEGTDRSTTGLPPPVERFAERAAPGGEPNPRTIRILGRGRFCRRPLPWLPMKVVVHVALGAERAQDLLVGAGPLTVMRVLDAYVDGQGITKAGRSADVGPRVDQGAFHPVVIETMLFPGAWSRLTGLRWEPIAESSARLVVPHAGGLEAAIVEFDRSTGVPSSYSVPRYKGNGPKVDWRIDLLDWGRLGGVTWPRRFVVTWADDPGPWYVMRTDRIELDADVDEALGRARAALAEAGG
jgi:hypothetical protein